MIDIAKMQEVLNNEETKKELANCKSNEEIQAYLNAKGIEITAEEVNAIMPKASENMDLDDMEAVAGGGVYGADYLDKFLDAWDGMIHGKWKKDTDVIGQQEQPDGSTLSVFRNGTMRLEKTLDNGVTMWQSLDEHGKPVGSVGQSFDSDGMHWTMQSF